MEKTDRQGTALVPMTLEGCVVRMADTISYIGRDIEDAIRLDLIKRSDLPSGITRLLGNTNGTIVYRLVTDLIQYSTPNPSLSFSPDISTALKKLKDFNYEHIYLNPKIKQNSRIIEQLFRHLFDTFLEDLVKKRRTSVIFTHFLEDMSENYIAAQRSEEIIRDFLAGMTDSYFLKLCPEEIRSKLTYG
jgi:dGTPase